MMYQYDNDCDANKNIALALYEIAYELHQLGLGEIPYMDGAQQLGALELLAHNVFNGLDRVASALNALANRDELEETNM